jgi:hypothetical protein
MSASPGAAVGKAVFDSYTAVKWQRSGEKVILVRRETNPDDLNGMIAAEGILTSRGGKTSHAAQPVPTAADGAMPQLDPVELNEHDINQSAFNNRAIRQ